MSLSFFGPAGSFERRWIVYALLRDNVQHHLESKTPTTDFAAIHTIGDALVTGKATVPARKLRDELVRAQTLLDRPAAELAVSRRTRAVCSLRFPLPDTRDTALASSVEWTAPYAIEDAKTLGDFFGSLVSELLRVTDGAGEADVVTVRDS
ncbi:MAG: hypothetical protein ACRELB_04475 [Polyangiaceae bacterium]